MTSLLPVSERVNTLKQSALAVATSPIESTTLVKLARCVLSLKKSAQFSAFLSTHMTEASRGIMLEEGGVSTPKRKRSCSGDGMSGEAGHENVHVKLARMSFGKHKPLPRPLTRACSMFTVRSYGEMALVEKKLAGCSIETPKGGQDGSWSQDSSEVDIKQVVFKVIKNGEVEATQHADMRAAQALPAVSACPPPEPAVQSLPAVHTAPAQPVLPSLQAVFAFPDPQLSSAPGCYFI